MFYMPHMFASNYALGLVCLNWQSNLIITHDYRLCLAALLVSKPGGPLEDVDR